MKKITFTLLIAVLCLSFSATNTLAGSSHRHGWVSTGITIGGCAPVPHVRHMSLAGPPPILFPVPPPFFLKTVTVRKGACCWDNHRWHHKRHDGHGEHYYKDGKKRDSYRHDKGKVSRFHRNKDGYGRDRY